jgi:hypothetical protein
MEAEREDGELGRRCDMGCGTWPDKTIYSKCPTCGEPTTRYKDVDPMPDDEAQAILLASQFEAFYEKRCAKLGIPADGPLPPAYERSLPSPRSLLG